MVIVALLGRPMQSQAAGELDAPRLDFFCGKAKGDCHDRLFSRESAPGRLPRNDGGSALWLRWGAAEPRLRKRLRILDPGELDRRSALSHGRLDVRRPQQSTV